MKSTLPTLDEICEEFGELEDGSERLQYLIEVGETLPEFPEPLRRETNRVQGCQSNVWVVGRATSDQPPRLELQADSDAPMVRGLVAVLLAAYSGRTAREILDFSAEILFERLRLRTFISPMRSNGLHSMVLFIRGLAEAADASRDQTPGAPTNTPPGLSPGKSHDAPTANREPADANSADGATSRTASTAGSRVEPAAPLTDDEVRRLRDDFPILSIRMDDGRPLVYLDNAATTQRPRAVIDAISEAYSTYFSNVHRGGHALAARTTERYEHARDSVRRLLNARRSHEVVFTSGTTAAINLVARSWGDSRLKAGDEIVLSWMEHHSNLVPWQQLAERTGCVIRLTPVTDDGRLDMDAFAGLLGPRTRLVAITAVSNVLGTINPIGEIVRRAHEVGAVALIDAAQAAPHQPLDVQSLDVDFLAFSGHKMLGPTGIGVLYGKESLLDAMPPFLGGGSMIRTVTSTGFRPALLPAKFEAGTPPIVDAIALGTAIEYLEQVGLPRIHAHEQALAELAHRTLAEIDGVRLLGPPPALKGGIATFTVDGLHPDEVAKALDAQGIAIRAGHHCAMPLHERLGVVASSRASFYLYNSRHEVEQLGEGLRTAIRLFAKARR